MHTEQCSNGIERGHAQRNTHGSGAKENEFTAPRNMHGKSKTCGNSSKPERRTVEENRTNYPNMQIPSLAASAAVAAGISIPLLTGLTSMVTNTLLN